MQADDIQRCLVTLCETRFIEHHDALIVFAKLYSSTLDALDEIALQSHDRKAADKARNMSRAVVDCVTVLCGKGDGSHISFVAVAPENKPRSV